MPELPLEERKLNFNEVDLGFTEELARKEAARCLSCRRCIGCGLCLAECDQCAIIYDEKETSVSIEADAIVFTSDGDLSDAARKIELGYGDAANVITSFEFERLTSPTGPFGGLIVRPFDGEIPKRIAFIQCVGSRDEAIGANYCSVECCSRTFAQARRVKEIAGDVEVRVFHKGLRPIGKASEVELQKLAGEKWIGFAEGAISSVKEDPETGAVTVRYMMDDKEVEETFDLVVLAVGLQSKRDFRDHAKVGGVPVNRYGFVDAGVVSMIACKDGVAFAGPIRGPQAGARSIIDAIAGASKALGSLDGRGDAGEAIGKPPTGSADAARPLVYACEYGLHLAGKAKSLVEEIKAGGFDINGSYPFLCYKDGREDIRRRLGEASGLVVLGCHSQSHERLFERVFDLPRGNVEILGQAELTEGLEARLTSLGEQFGTAAASPNLQAKPQAKARAASYLKPRVVAVLGGGVSGLAAASELLRRRLKVIIIEKSETIGANLAKVLPTGQHTDAKVIEDFVKAVEASPEVQILKSARLTAVGTENNVLKLTVATPKGDETLEAGAMIIATGAAPYVPTGFGFGGSKAVLRQEDFKARLAQGDAPWKKIVMVQCVGARDAKHPYCSRFCCREALANALVFKHVNPQGDVTVLHKGIRALGFDEELYTEAIERGVAFIEIEKQPSLDTRPSYGSAGDVGSSLKVGGQSGGGKSFDLECDALVLSVAHSRNGDAIEIAGKTGVALDPLGFFETRKPAVEPFASSVEGVFVCGFARAPVTVEEAFADGIGVAGAACRYLGQ